MANYLDYEGLKQYHDRSSAEVDKKIDNVVEQLSEVIAKSDENTFYVPSDKLSNDLEMTEKHGGLDKMSVGDFRTNPMTHNELFDAILFPTLQPTVVNPSITLNYSGSKTIEVGSTLPAKSAFTSTINRGSSTYGNVDGESYYAGTAGDVEYKINSGDTLWETISECKSYTVIASTTFADGVKLLNNKGGEATVPSYSSSSMSSSVTINACYNVYATTTSVGTLTKQTLRTKSGWNGQILTTVPEVDGELSTSKFRLDVPKGWNVSAKQENPNKVNVYDIDVDLTKVGTTTYTDANGADVEYDIWTRTSDVKNTLTEGVKIKLTIS